MFRFRTDHESADILHEEDRNALPVGVLDEVRHLLGTLGIDDPAEPRLLAGAPLDEAALVGDHRDGAAVDPARGRTAFRGRGRAGIRRARHRRAGSRARDACRTTADDHAAADRTAHRRSVRAGLASRPSCRARTSRQPVDVFANPLQALGIRCGAVVGHTAHFGMRARAAERLTIDHLTRRALDEVGTAQPHERRPIDHEDDVGQRRKVRAPGDAASHYGGDLRYVQVAAHQRVVIEDPRGAVLPGNTPS